MMELKPAGIVFTGGNSLVKYGGDAPERDETEYAMLKLALEYDIPVYGFCRGMQTILDFYGCELSTVTGHVAVRHDIDGMLGKRNVNSTIIRHVCMQRIRWRCWQEQRTE